MTTFSVLTLAFLLRFWLFTAFKVRLADEDAPELTPDEIYQIIGLLKYHHGFSEERALDAIAHPQQLPDEIRAVILAQYPEALGLLGGVTPETPVPADVQTSAPQEPTGDLLLGESTELSEPAVVVETANSTAPSDEVKSEEPVEEPKADADQTAVKLEDEKPQEPVVEEPKSDTPAAAVKSEEPPADSTPSTPEEPAKEVVAPTETKPAAKKSTKK